VTDYNAIVTGMRDNDADRLRRALFATRNEPADLTPIETAAATGVPVDVVKRNPDIKARNLQVDRLLKESPGLSMWLTENALHAGMANDEDELSTLGALDWLLTAPAKAFRSGQAQVEFGRARSAAGVAPTPGDELRLADLRVRMQAGQGDLGGEYWWSQGLVGSARQLPTLAANLREWTRGGLVGGMAAGGGAAMLGQAGPQIALPEEVVTVPAATLAGFVMGGRVTGAAFGFDQERGHAMGEFDDIRDESGNPLDPNVAWMAANAAGALSAGLEVAGVELFLKAFPGLSGATSAARRQAIGALLKVPSVRTALADAAKSYGTLLAQETGIEVAQRAMVILGREAAKISSGQEFAVDSSAPILSDLGNEGVEALKAMTFLTAPGPVLQAGFGVQEANQAKQRAQFFQALGEVAAESKTAKQSPTAMQGLVERLTKNGPVETVYAPIEAWNTYFQSQNVDPREVAAQVLGSPEAYDQVALSGGDLPIPTARYAARLAGTVHNGELAKVLRFAPDQMNLVEAEQFVKDAEAAEAAIPSEPDSVEAIRQDVIGMLRTTGADQILAESQAEVIAAFYRTQGQNMGVDPKALYDRFPLDVRGEIPEALRRVTSIDQFDAMLDRVRRGDLPSEAEARGESLTEMLVRWGGIQDQGGELRGMDANKSRRTRKRLVTENGLTYDDAALYAFERGFIPEADVNLLLDAIDTELRGQPVYSTANENAEAQNLRMMAASLESELQRMGLSLSDMTNEQVKAALLPQEISGTEMEQPGYHGSPYRFHRFDLSKIGTGEGAQAYGWGIYFAENSEVAGQYRDVLSQQVIVVDGVRIPNSSLRLLPDAERAALSAVSHQGVDKTLARAKEMLDEGADPEWIKRFEDAIETLRGKEVTRANDGALYTVDIPDDAVAKMLDWDKPLSEQAPEVREAINGILDSGVMDPDSVRAIRDYDSPGSVIYKMLAADTKAPGQAMDAYPGAEGASRRLASVGIPGVRYLDAGSRGAGDGTRNFVIWDQQLLDRISDSMETTLEQPADGAARGRVTFGPATDGRRPFNIRLMEKADRSTFLHESGHMFLEVFGDLAENGTDQQKADYQTLLKWMGVTERRQIQRDQHEQFARGFESYLMEGKAPSAGLRRVFARFRSWLVALYRTAAGLNVELTDDVRRVMDRLLATEEEIKAAEAEANVEALLTPETAGMSATEFEAYRTLVVDAGVQARDILMQRLMVQLEREQAKWWKVERDKLKEEVTGEIDAMPGYRALAAIRRNELPEGLPRPEGMETLKLDREALESRYGKATRPRGELRAQAPASGMLGTVMRGEATKAPPVFTPQNTVMNRLRDLKVTRTDGLAPELAASLFGFRDAQELVDTLVNLRPRKELIEAETDRRMRERYPDIRFDGSLADEAAAAVQNEKREDVLRAEIAALRRKQREIAPFVRAQQRAAGERKRAGLSLVRGAVPDVATVRETARRIIAGKRIRDLRPQDYLATARVQARMALEAVARGDDEVKADPKRGLPGYESGWAWAADLKARELLNHHLYREALAAQERVQKTVEYANRLQKEPARGRLGKAGADYLEQVDALLGRFNLRPISAKALARKDSLRDWIAKQQEQGAQIDLPEEVVNEAFQKSYRELTVEEFLGIGDSLKTIETAAKLKNKLLTAQAKREWQEAKTELLDRAKQQTGRAPPVSPFERSTSQALRDGAKLLADVLLRPETLVEWLDGGETGPWHEFFWDLANQAEYRREQLRDKVMRPLLDLTNGMDRVRRKQLDDDIRIDALGMSLDQRTLISIALNMGNAGNRERLLKGGMLHFGKRVELTEAALAEITERLNRDDWTLIQAMWDTVESLWPEARDLEERLTGVAPPKVEATAVVAGGETYRGGYWPVVYDPFGSRAGEKQAEAGDAVDKLLGSTFTRATTKKGHLKARTGAAGPLLLDFERVLGRHVGEVITDLTHREFILQGLKILRDPEVKLALLDAIGEGGYGTLNKMLRNVVHQDGNVSSVAERSVNSILGRALSNTVVAALGFRAVTAVGNMILAPVQATARVAPLYVAKGFGRFYGAPRAMRDFIHARSPMMQQRATNMDATFVDVLTRLRGQSGLRAQTARAAMAVHRWADFLVTHAIWLGRYEQALANGSPETEAASLADKAIRQTQTAGAPKDLADVESIPWVKKTGLTMFLGPMLIMGNRMQEAARLKGVVKNWPEAFGTMLATWILPAVLWDLATGRGPEDDEDDDLGNEALWAFRKIVLYPFLTVPLLRDVAAVADARMDGKRLDPRANPAVQAAMLVVEAGEQAYKAGQSAWEGDDIESEKLVKAALRASGPLVGLPSNQLMTSGEFLHDVMTGEFEPEGVSDWRYLAIRRPE
jgi:hypothetical protein